MKLILEKQNSQKSYKTYEVFGLNNRERELQVDLDVNILNESIVFITGFSGSGKTTLARKLSVLNSYLELNDSFDHSKPIIDLINHSFKKSLYFLNIVGICEPFLYITPYEFLSTGQKFRFCIAKMLSEGYKKIFIDEFCSYLDRDTAKFISYNIRKITYKLGVQFILVTSHVDLEQYLFPDIKIYISFDEPPKIQYCSVDISFPFTNDLYVKKGTYSDYLSMEKFHYFDSSPKEICEIFNFRYYSLYYKKLLIGVLVFKKPYPNNEEDTEFLDINENLHIIHRIIIHPIARGTGITKYFFNKVKILFEQQSFFVSSALAKYIPFFDSMGFKSINKNRYDKCLAYQKLKKLLIIEDKNNNDEIICLQKVIYAKILFWYYKSYCELLSKNLLYTECDFIRFFENADEIFNINTIDYWKKELEYFDMAYYTYRKMS